MKKIINFVARLWKFSVLETELKRLYHENDDLVKSHLETLQNLARVTQDRDRIKKYLEHREGPFARSLKEYNRDANERVLRQTIAGGKKKPRAKD